MSSREAWQSHRQISVTVIADDGFPLLFMGRKVAIPAASGCQWSDSVGLNQLVGVGNAQVSAAEVDLARFLQIVQDGVDGLAAGGG